MPEEEGSTPKDKGEKIKGVYPWGSQWPPPKGAGNYGDQSAKRKYQEKFPKAIFIEGYDDGFANTAPVGSFAPNQYGLYDLSGNVLEWCEDWYEKEQKSRVLRGGSWDNYEPRYLLSSYRRDYVPGGRNITVGFRVVLVVGGSVREVSPPL